MEHFEGPVSGRAMAEGWERAGEIKIKLLLRQFRRTMTACRRRIRQLARAGETEALSGLREQEYLLSMARRSVLEGFSGVKRLPAVGEPEMKPRIVEVARGILSQPSPLDAGEIGGYLAQVQNVTPLREAELERLLPALQLVAFEELVRALEQGGSCRRVLDSLRTWNQIDFSRLTEQASGVHTVLLQDAAGAYPQMPGSDRREYRRRLAALAKKAGMEEADYARTLLEQAGERHIGFLLWEPGMPEQILRRCYFPVLYGVSLLLSVLIGLLLGQGWSFVLLWLPLLHTLKAVADRILLHYLPRRPVFRLSLPRGIPEEGKTLLVKTTLLTDAAVTDGVPHLERIWLANRDCGEHLVLGLLVDLPESEVPMDQRGRELLRRLTEETEALNRRYGGRFFLLFRMPVYHEKNGTYAGWERKRGALMELAGLLRGKETGLRVCAGEEKRLRGTKYLLTLDSDTDPGVGHVRPLVGAMLHPLNRPVLDSRRRVVTSGYAILQPQIRTRLSGACANPFAQLFCGGMGTDPYRGSGSELHHDLFDEASFCGKGIIDVDCMLFCLEGRFPEQRVLSHDILEGACLRCGTMGQISFTDGFPGSITAYYKRQHRWVRGDWQNLPWTGDRVPTGGQGRDPNPLSAVSRWKLADSLRRSLTPAVQLLCLLWGCLGPKELRWLAWLGLLSLLIEPLLSLCGIGFRRLPRLHAPLLVGRRRALAEAFVRLVLLPLEAWTNAAAITTALWRSFVSHRKLLQWSVSGAGEGQRGSQGAIPAFAAGGILAVFAHSGLGMALALVWLTSPLTLTLLERKRPTSRLTGEERTFLTHEAELIWGYFADLLGPERNFLPPDNLQLHPRCGVAERTSPTNIGFALLSCLAAVDLDLEERERALSRLCGLLNTLDRMEKWKGNLYNWYDTLTLRPLEPKVISSVDSGNLCACLLAAAAGLKELGETELGDQALRLARETDLGSLYDRTRNLFYVTVTQEGTGSAAHYDLMASEARLLSFTAIALGQVPERHWRTLSRAQAAAGGCQGMVSWSGTMFEYFMPHLLLPAQPCSALGESLAFCAAEQLRQGQRQGCPWGVSESALPERDELGRYRYQANGLPSLALGSDTGDDRVISPYSTCLALNVLPHRAVENLRRLHRCGLAGKYGLYESARFGKNGVKASKSWMAHHMGMSLTALDNALNGGLFVRRFLAWPETAACLPLLEEPVPLGGGKGRKTRRNGNSSKNRVPTAEKSCIIVEPYDFEEAGACPLTTDRIELMPGVWLTTIRTRKFKSSYWSLRLFAPLKEETAAMNAVLPYVLRRGTSRLPDMEAISAELDELYGGAVEPAVTKCGDVQCVGFNASFLDDAMAPEGEPILERAAALLGDLLLHPATKNGRLRGDYVRSEKENLKRQILSIRNDKRLYVREKLIRQLYAGTDYAVGRLGSVQQAEKINVARLFDHYQDLLERSPLELYYCGSAPAKRVEMAWREALMGLPRGAERYEIGTDVHRRTGAAVPEWRETLDVVQGKMELCFQTGFGLDDPLYPAMLVVNAMFGGTPNSRLFLHVREERSLCYYVSSTLVSVKGLMLVSCGADADRFETVKAEILEQLGQLQRGEFSQAEFESARRSVVNSLNSALDEQGRLCQEWLKDSAAGEPFDLPRLIRQVEEVNEGQAAAAALELQLAGVCYLSGLADEEGGAT